MDIINTVEKKTEKAKRKVCSITTEFGIRYTLAGLLMFGMPLGMNYSFYHGYEFYQQITGVLIMLYGQRQLKFSKQIEQYRKKLE